MDGLILRVDGRVGKLAAVSRATQNAGGVSVMSG